MDYKRWSLVSSIGILSIFSIFLLNKTGADEKFEWQKIEKVEEIKAKNSQKSTIVTPLLKSRKDGSQEVKLGRAGRHYAIGKLSTDGKIVVTCSGKEELASPSNSKMYRQTSVSK